MKGICRGESCHWPGGGLEPPVLGFVVQQLTSPPAHGPGWGEVGGQGLLLGKGCRGLTGSCRVFQGGLAASPSELSEVGGAGSSLPLS